MIKIKVKNKIKKDRTGFPKHLYPYTSIPLYLKLLSNPLYLLK
jgi:hypothetical protein